MRLASDQLQSVLLDATYQIESVLSKTKLGFSYDPFADALPKLTSWWGDLDIASEKSRPCSKTALRMCGFARTKTVPVLL